MEWELGIKQNEKSAGPFFFLGGGGGGGLEDTLDINYFRAKQMKQSSIKLRESL